MHNGIVLVGTVLLVVQWNLLNIKKRINLGTANREEN